MNDPELRARAALRNSYAEYLWAYSLAEGDWFYARMAADQRALVSTLTWILSGRHRPSAAIRAWNRAM